MTTTLTRDRAYFRMCDDITLLRLADDSRDELAIVLAERLAEIARMSDSYDCATAELAEAFCTIDRLRDQIDDLEEEVEYLRDTIIAERKQGDE